MSTIRGLTYGASNAIPLHLVSQDSWDGWLDQQDAAAQRWLKQALRKPKSGAHALIPGSDGAVRAVVALTASAGDLSVLQALAEALPAGNYQLQEPVEGLAAEDAAWYWTSGQYRFQVGRRAEQGGDSAACLVLDEDARPAELLCEARTLVRDLINTPAADLGPQELAKAAKDLASAHQAQIEIVEGPALESGFPMVHAVGKGAARKPLLIDLRWGVEDAPRVTLVGKGVIFDSGGLDIKASSFMRNMKKDMGGAAHVLGLAKIIMGRALPVRLRVLIPAVENAISGECFRPGDILRSRHGLAVEIHNTDAEGRLVLADALSCAGGEDPELLLDFATLTGAARVAVGTDLPALFSDNDELAEALLELGRATGEPMWRLPLYAPYRSLLDSTVADISNASGSAYAGAITAALFLKEFVDRPASWAHLDLFAWNETKKPGRPAGGESMSLRAVWRYLEQRYGGTSWYSRDI